jgi:WD40 repeat protein
MATNPAALVVFGGHGSAEARAFISTTSRSDKEPGVFDLAFADNSTVVSGGLDNEARVWDARTGVERRFDDATAIMNRTLSPIIAVAVARKRGIAATAAVDGCLRVFDVATGRTVAVNDFAGAEVACLFSPDERLIACGGGTGTITVLRAGRFICICGRPEPQYMLDVEYPDGPTLVTDPTLAEDFEEPEVLCRLLQSDSADQKPYFHGGSLAWLDSTTLVAAGSYGFTCIWDVARATSIQWISHDYATSAIFEIATSPVASFIAFCTLRHGGRLYRRASPSAFQMTQILEDAKSPAFTPDGDCLALLDSQGIAIISVHSGAVTRYFRAPVLWDHFGTLALSPDGRRLAVTDRHANVQTFALDTPRSLLVKLLLLRVAPPLRTTRRVTRIDEYVPLQGARKVRRYGEYVDEGPVEPRVVVADAARSAPRLLCRLADTGHVDTASYALKFLF